jgi:signal transduction histidine kinase
LRIDPIHTAYAIGHLVENAINASSENAEVEISAQRGAEPGEYTLTVKDTGVGMAPEKIASAFTPFTQTENVRTRSREGIGLGLTLARKILNDQNADLRLESEPGVGTRAIVTFKLSGDAVAAAA